MAKLKCPDCGHQVKADMDSCPECGRKIAGSTFPCPSCGQLVSKRRKVCPYCHKRTDGEDGAAGEAGPAEKEEGRSFWFSFLMTLGCITVVAAAVAGGLWWQKEEAQAREREAYLLLDGCIQVSVYEDFIEKYPDSPLLQDVVQRMKAVSKLADEWEIVCHKDAKKTYADFADSHMDTPYYKLCMAKMDSIDWTAADRQGTAAAYARYIESHPNGIYAEDARERKKTQEELRVTSEERAMLQGLFNTYFAALTNRNEHSLRQVLAFMSVRYWGRDNASQDYAVERMKRMYDGSDVRSIAFIMRDDWQIEKEIVRPYRYAYKVAFKADALYNRTKAGKERNAVFQVEAHVSVDHKIDRMELKKETPEKSVPAK